MFGAAMLALAVTGCGATQRPVISKIRLAGGRGVVRVLRACLEEPCVARPKPGEPKVFPKGLIAPMRHSDQVWASLLHISEEDEPRGLTCPAGPLPRVVDTDCNPVPLRDWVLSRDADGKPVRFEATALRTKGLPPGYDLLEGEAVKLGEAKKLTAAELAAIYRWRRGLPTSLDSGAKARARHIFPDSRPGPSREMGYCGSAKRDAVLEVLKKRPGDALELRAKLFTEEHIRSDTSPEPVRVGRVVVHQAVAKPLVPPIPICEGNSACSGSAVAHTVAERVGQVADYAIERFADLLRPEDRWTPANPLEIYVEPESNYGATDPEVTYIVIDPRVVGPASSLVPRSLDWGVIPHEVFHRVQYRYQASPEGPARGALVEGGAVWAEDLIHPNYNHYAAAGQFFLDGVNATPSLVAPAPGAEGDTATYSAGLFWKYVEERSPRASRLGFARGMLSAMRDQGHTLGAVAAITRPVGGFDAVWMSFLLTNYIHGRPPRPHFDYLEATHPVLWPDSRGTTIEKMRVRPALAAHEEGEVAAWAAQYILFRRPGARTQVSFSWHGASASSPLVAALPVRVAMSPREDGDARLARVDDLELVRAEGEPALVNGQARVHVPSDLVVIVGGRGASGRYNLVVAPAE